MAEIILANLSDISGFATNTLSVAGTSYSAASEGIYLLSQSASFVFTLPAGSLMATGGFLMIKDVDGTAQTRPITVTGGGVLTIDGALTKTIDENYGELWVMWNGNGWSTMGRFAPWGRILTNGNATLIGGTVTVAFTNIATTDVLMLSRKTLGGTPGNLSYTISSLVSFTIDSSSAIDTSTVSYALIR